MMRQNVFSRTDTLLGWLVFLTAATVYVLTIEPSASLWDCPEFITAGYKLEIGHPPGAPFYMLTANLFAQLADSPSQVARMVNMLSALLSAGCILFLFWTITHLSRRLIAPDNRFDWPRVILIEGCGVIGALAYTFSDTFWFSAVEAEVYAYSSFLTALVFWLILKWEELADDPQSDCWIVLIAYIIGLSVGVHLLNLLCIPAMALVVCFRKCEKITWWEIIKALAAGGSLLLAILYGFIPGIIWLGGMAELLFVNVMGLPQHTGLISSFILIIVGLAALQAMAGNRVLRTSLLSTMMLLVGISCYAVILIRSAAHPPMDENSPDNVFSLSRYMSREQYGDTPLLKGPAYCSEVAYQPKGEYLVAKEKPTSAIRHFQNDSLGGRYVTLGHHSKLIYKDNMWFPRMHSFQPQHVRAYEEWMGGVEKKGNLPTTRDNLRFFLSYQCGFMYWRYFLWNFVGRQNNIQGNGEVEHGNWITGIKPVDDILLGCDTRLLPSDLRNNKGRNVYYALPLLLGLLGMGWQLRCGKTGKRQWGVVAVLFLMTGLAIVVYLNQPPLPPRERDYVYAGSFYAFSIWIGMGVAAVASWLGRCIKLRAWSVSTAVILCGVVPLQMVSQTWDDHDRSGRYACRDFGHNYLESMQRDSHPIILTNGDNDTFPLWYNHEVEGVRTDTRDCNLQYVNTDWYIDQMKRPAYDSPPFPFHWDRKDYQEGTNEYVQVRPELKEQVMELYKDNPEEMRKTLGEKPFELRNIIRHWVLSDDPLRHCIPTDSVTVTSDEGQMIISLKNMRGVYKKDLFVLDLLAHTDWKRPIYTSISLGPDEVPYLSDHLVLEGLAYRVVPDSGGTKMDVERMYENVMKRFRYGGLNRKGIFVDEDVMHMARTHQYVMAILIDSLLARGDNQRALAVVGKWQKELPSYNIPYTDAALSMAKCYYENGYTCQGDEIVADLLQRSEEWLRWTESIKPSRKGGSLASVNSWLHTMQQALNVAAQYRRDKLIENYYPLFQRYANQ